MIVLCCELHIGDLLHREEVRMCFRSFFFFLFEDMLWQAPVLSLQALDQPLMTGIFLEALEPRENAAVG